MSNQNSVFKALSDPTRRKILQLLKERDLTAGEIADSFSISKPSISHHLNLLKQADLVMDERQGQNIVYSLNTTVFQELLGFFLNFIDKEEVDKNEI
ncbi:winged helix-turn-helix transcriptional regulator [Anoxybacterium hadale]|uniref:Winged helix-turn-helix transcriptional regulator n=1 Tax=Anoxybacterium hadale TaxID=3408580 RepID=A0ACD1A9N9_9FIRM|nr:winged helix-turn-helix transcriptional regulator [Clostridiales bacterium]